MQTLVQKNMQTLVQKNMQTLVQKNMQTLVQKTIRSASLGWPMFYSLKCSKVFVSAFSLLSLSRDIQNFNNHIFEKIRVNLRVYLHAF